MQKISICSGSGKSCNKGILKHIAASSGILTDHDSCAVFLAVIPSDITSHFEGMLHCQHFIGFTTEAVCSKIPKE